MVKKLLSADKNEPAVPAVVSISVFGTFTVTIGGKPMAYVRPPVKMAFGILVFNHDREVSRIDIDRACWSANRDSRLADPTPSQDLNTAVYKLTKIVNNGVEHILKSVNRTLKFSTASSVELDLLDFEASIDEGTADGLERAYGYLTGRPLFEGWEAETWVQKARQTLQGLLRDSLLSTLSLSRDVSDWPTVTRCYGLLLKIEPAESSHWQGWLKHLAQRRRFNQMRSEYRRFAAVAPRLSMPTEAVAACFHALEREAAVFKIGPERGNLPNPLNRYIEHPQNVEMVTSLLAAGSRLVTLVGPGGIGKTRLAQFVGHLRLEEYRDRVWFVDLGVLDPIDEEAGFAAILTSVAHALRLIGTHGQSLEDTVRDHLIGREMLLILDNCEHVLFAVAGFMRFLLMSCPDLQILTTSREPVGIEGEAVLNLYALDYPPEAKRYLPQQLMRSTSVQLLLERASTPQRPIEVDDQNANEVAAICRRLEGIPFALELAGIQVASGHMTVEDLASSLETRLYLSSGYRAATPRQRTLNAVIDWSFRLLTEGEKLMLMRLSTFRGSFTREAAVDICSISPLSHESASASIGRLSGKSLLQQTGNISNRRLVMLGSLREYAAEKLAEFDEPTTNTRSTLQRRHLEYLIRDSTERLATYRQSGDASCISQQTDERENVHAVLQWALHGSSDGSVQLAIELGCLLGWYYYTSGHYAEGIAQLERVLARCPSEKTDQRLTLLQSIGNLAYAHGDFEAALSHFQTGLVIREAKGNKAGIATGRSSIASTLDAMGEHAQALKILTENAVFFAAAGDWSNYATCLNNMGRCCHELEQFDNAVGHYAQSLDQHRRLKAPADVSLVVCNLAVTFLSMSRFDDASTNLRECLQICLITGNRARVARCLNVWASLAVHQQQWDLASKLAGFLSHYVPAHVVGPDRGTMEPVPGLEQVRAYLGDIGFSLHYEQGQLMSIEEIAEQLEHV